MIENVDIHYIGHQSLRQLVGVVPQQTDLFSGTVLENIAPGTFEPDLERVLSICRKLGIMRFIETLPLGLDAAIGENGMILSGGQRQRLAIARVLYRNPGVMVLDEASASMDTASAKSIRGVLFSLRQKGRTIIVFPNQLSNVAEGDKHI